MVARMGLPTALRRWLPAALLLAALGCAFAAAQPAQAAGGPATGSAIGHGTADAAGRLHQTARAEAADQAATPTPTGGAADTVAALPAPESRGAGCGDDAPTAAPPDHAASPRTDGAAHAGAPVAADGAPPPGTAARPGPGSAAASPAGLLLADLSVRRT